MATVFPKKLFVKLETGSDDTHWFAAQEDCADLADETSGTISVGVYELVGTGKLATKSEFLADKARRQTR